MSNNGRYAEVEIRLKEYISAELPKVVRHFNTLNSEIAKSEVVSLKVATAQKRLETAASQTATAQHKVSAAATQAAISEKKLEAASTQAEIAQKRLEMAALRLEKAHKKHHYSMSTLIESVVMLKNATIAYIAVKAAQHVYTTATAIESLDYKMKASVKGFGEASETMKWISTEADRIGLHTRSAAEGFASFAAASTRAGMSLDVTKKIWTDIAETSVSMRLGAAQTERVFLALNQMASKGVVSMEELRQQMGESLPGALGIAAKSMNMTVPAFSKLVESGGLLASEFLPKFSSAIRNELGSEFEAGANSAVANIERMKSRFDELYKVVGEDLLPVFNDLLGWLAKSDGAFAKSTAAIGRYSQLLGGKSLDMINYSDNIQGKLDFASKTSRPYAERLLRETSFGVSGDIKETEEAIKRLQNAPSVTTPGGNGIGSREAQLERLKRRLEDLRGESEKVNEALNSVINPASYPGSTTGGSENNEAEEGSKNRLEDQLMKSSFRYYDQEAGPATEFAVDVYKIKQKEYEETLALRKSFDESKLALIKDASEREVEELRVRQAYEIEMFRGTEEQKKLILQKQLNESTALERQHAAERKTLHNNLALAIADSSKGISDSIIGSALNSIDIGKEKEAARALVSIKYAVAAAEAALSIWLSPKPVAFKVVESAKAGTALAAGYAVAMSNINKYEMGTNYSRGGRALVGERGPEIIDLPAGSRVTPNNQVSAQQPINVTMYVTDNSGNITNKLQREFRNGDGREVINYITDQVRKAR
jgi:tape measure domain-containing protein